MASRNSIHPSTDLDDLSLETTVPTDLSFSPDEEGLSDLLTIDDDRRRRHGGVVSGPSGGGQHRGGGGGGGQANVAARLLLEKKHLQHDVQALKIELSQKSFMLDNIKGEYMQKVEELEEKLGEAMHQRQILQSRLDSQLHIDKDDSRRRQEQIQKELDAILFRQQQLEATNARLQEKAVDIRRSLADLELTDAQYHELRLQGEDDLALKDFVAMKLHEREKPWRLEVEALRPRLKTATEELGRSQQALQHCRDDLEEEKKGRFQAEEKNQRLSNSLTEVRGQLQLNDYRIENYDRVKRERDEFDSALSDLKKQHAYVESSYECATKERDELTIETASLKQTVQLLTQDKDYLTKQLAELTNKLSHAEDRTLQLNDQLERAKQGREELYDKYVASRDQYKVDYEDKLHTELEQIRIRTNADIDRLKSSTREMYERENRILREARDIAISEKERAISVEKETNTKYEQLLQDFRHQQMTNDTKLSEAHSEAKLRAFEAERTQLVYEETVRTLKEAQIEQDKLQKKLEVMTKQYYGLQMSLEKRISELETVVSDKATKLETYERLEAELDDVVMQAAEVENEDEAERVMFSYGYGANVPTTAKRRLRQSVQLARRVLQLERANTSMRKELEREGTKVKQLAGELQSTNKVLDESHQPYHYLVESIRQRDLQIGQLKEHCATLEADLRRIEKERNELSRSKNQMAVDLERLLNHKEEMSVMKQVVLNMSQGNPNAFSAAPKSVRYSPPSRRRASPNAVKSVPGVKKPGPAPRVPTTFEPAERDENVHKPGPTQFTVNGQPEWHKQLKQRNSNNPQINAKSRQPVG